MLVLLATVNHAQVPPGAAGGNPMMPQGFPTPEQMQAQMENMQKMGMMPDAQTMQQMQAQQPPAGARNSRRSIIAPRFLITPPAAPRVPASHFFAIARRLCDRPLTPIASLPPQAAAA